MTVPTHTQINSSKDIALEHRKAQGHQPSLWSSQLASSKLKEIASLEEDAAQRMMSAADMLREEAPPTATTTLKTETTESPTLVATTQLGLSLSTELLAGIVVIVVALAAIGLALRRRRKRSVPT